MNKLRISAISYLNTVPFIHGIKNSGFLEDYELSFDVPSTCARKLREGEADIGIVPVAAIPEIPHAQIVTDYCIGATGPVKTVLLVAMEPLDQLHTLLLDPDSRTSVQLVRILAKHFWKKEFHYKTLTPEQWQVLAPGTGAVVIGDKTFGLEGVFPYQYDLAGQWVDYTALPFVFACWVSRIQLPEVEQQKLNRAMRYGLENLDEVIALLNTDLYQGVDLHSYYRKNLSYTLDDEKRAGMEKFLSMISS